MFVFEPSYKPASVVCLLVLPVTDSLDPNADPDRRLFVDYILQLGYALVIASSYENCAESLKNQQPHLILFHAMSASLDDKQFLTYIRTDELLKRAPIVALTNAVNEDAIIRLVESGLLFCLPFRRSVLTLLFLVSRFFSLQAPPK